MSSAVNSLTSTHVVFMGLMTSGKTTIGSRVAQSLGLPFDDSDLDIQQRTGRTGRDIAGVEGVEVLHEMEASSLLRSLSETEPRVITAAASTIENAECRGLLRELAFVVFLDIDVDLMLERFAHDDHRRLITRLEMETMRERRLPLFSSVADLTLDAASAAEEMVARTLEALEAAA